MIFLLNNWRWIALALVIASLSAYGAFWKHRAGVWEERYETEKTAFQTFKSQVAAMGAAAQKAAEVAKARQKKTNEEVAKNEEDTRRRIHDYFGLRVPADNPGGGGLPPAPEAPGVPNAAAAEQGAGGPSVESCALDAAQVMAWQAWARAQGLAE
jgi:hypothetical protein